jgi:probable rRNA maturation factor
VNSPADLLRVTFQLAIKSDVEGMPDAGSFELWANAAAHAADVSDLSGASVTVRIVAAAESAALNLAFRDQQGPTNVLAFPAPQALLPEDAGSETEVGDLAICLEVALREAAEQGKSLQAHLAHLTIHGTLHLLGYDHGNESEAAAMEGLEVHVMAGLGLPDPYAAVGAG